MWLGCWGPQEAAGSQGGTWVRGDTQWLRRRGEPKLCLGSQEDHVNGARGLLGWAGKEYWEQGSRGCGGGA